MAVIFAVAITLFIFFSRDWLEQYAVYGYPSVFFISLLGNATLILPAPSYAIVFAMGGILNPVWTGLAAGAGAATGEMTGYLLGYGGQATIPDSERYQRLVKLMDRWGLGVIFLLGLIPNPIFDVGGIIAGVLKLPWWQFWLAAAAGKGIRFALLAWVGGLGFSIFEG